MRYIIPQEFDQSDKIGKITVPQAVVLAIGATIFVLIVISSSLLVSLLSFIPIAITTCVFMFVKVNKVPLYEFLMIYVLYVGTPKLLIYRSDNLKSFEDKEDEIGFIEYQKKETPKNEKQKTNKKPVQKINQVKKSRKESSNKKPIPKKKGGK